MKKVITLLLALAMVLAMFVACKEPGIDNPGESSSNNGGNANASTPSQGGDQSTPPEESENEYDLIGIPELNYEEDVINIACWNAENPEFEVNAEDQNGDPILDAIYKRNLYTEQMLGVELAFTPIPGAGNQSEIISWCETAKNMQSDPSTPVDILACYSRTAAYATINGLNQDITVYDYINLEKEWWPKNVREEFSIGNKLFFITGDISTNVLHMMYCIFYNKTLCESYGLGDPVQMVNERTWTMDQWQSMTADLYEDMDDVAGKSAGDRYGAGFQYYHLDAIVQGCGFKLMKNTDEDGKYMDIHEDFYSQKLDAWVSGMVDWVKTDDVWNDTKYGAEGSTETAFLESRSVFQINRATFGFKLQETDVDYGILPPPMLDPSEQEGYVTSLGNPYTIYSMSASTIDGERAAAVLQTMGYYGMTLTTPAIFDVTFKGKFSKDPNAIEMFNLVRGAIGFDLGILYMRELNYMCDIVTNNAISAGKQWSVVMNAFMKKTMDTQLGKLNGKLEMIVNR